jgi:hypothetical protein
MLNSARTVLRSIPMSLLALDGHLVDFGPRGKHIKERIHVPP